MVVFVCFDLKKGRVLSKSALAPFGCLLGDAASLVWGGYVVFLRGSFTLLFRGLRNHSGWALENKDARSFVTPKVITTT